MEIKTSIEGTKAIFGLEGKLTVQTAPELEAAIDAVSQEACDFAIDLAGVDYVSSAGLRVFVAADKLAMKRGGSLVLMHPREDVTEVLEMTGLADVLVIER
ncbi:MAG: STAS domain-containing protein [Atopobiaceae bacterium]|nr:STAS domain-containing protein [Atopobiaceae bacterium]MBQ3283006.1 STAS domain-containing protein [Atopobiaceae bacterium]MBQ6410969.1 STAS domain-containing protein [Atopobiaceae bacterium]MBQ6650359.1 STAS domain-containing protein [Atopobiaceae bacterium]